MAARADAAAWSSRTYSCIFAFLSVLSLLSQALSHRLRYGRVKLLKIGNRCQDYTIGNLNSIPLEILQPKKLSGSGTIITLPVRPRRQRRERKQKQGKIAGVRARLQANPHRPTLTSLFLKNSQSLVNKMDEIRLRITSHCMDSCVMVIADYQCTSTDIIKTHCSPDIEYLILKCRPFYVPREFTVILIQCWARYFKKVISYSY